MSQDNNNNKSDSAKKNEDWMNSKWRPMMGWMYMLVCTTDFVLFPVLWSLVQAVGEGRVEMQWNPITLQGAGLFHMAMGAILGIAAFGRTQEKIAGANNGGIAPPPAPISMSAPVPMTMVAPTPVPSSATVTNGFGGKAAPLPAPQPEL
tara:strand:+ start:2708 stop:3154 length:447 start_codon:yes stop_codon:yes gene_type:complete